MTDAGFRVTFTPSGRRGTAAAGATVLDVARELGADIDSVCGGRGICGRCQVTVGASPGVPASPDVLSARGPTEVDYRGKRPIIEDRRLACAARICGDVVIDVPPDSQVHRQVVRKRAEVVAIDVDPVVKLHYIEVAAPTLDDAGSDLGRVIAALGSQWDLTGLTADPTLLPQLQPALRQGNWQVTVAVHYGTDVTGIWPGFRDVALGVAYDVGSTTIAAHLCDLASGDVLASAGIMNPQIRFGEDLMSRVSYVMMNPGGERQLTAVVREAMNDLIDELVADAGVARADILEVTVVGNPIMHHLVLGIDPTPLGTAPFALAVDGAVTGTAAQIGLDTHPGGRLYLLPCIAGHVGADAAAAVLSEGPHRGDAVQLLVDVGTNAEIVLGSAGRLLAASSPTGPAFEGAQISAGQRAAPGAIERVRIDRDSLEARYKVIGSDLWSDEAGFADSIEKTGVTGICGSGIIEAVAELYLSGVISRDGVVGGQSPRIIADGRTSSYVLDAGTKILVTQNDVRAIQLAKAALYAGVKLLMGHLGVDSVDEIRLAGAFGSHIDTKYAMVLGLIPDCDLAKVSSAGNAAGTGSIMALLSRSARAEVEQVATEIEKIETATEARFQELFLGAMAIPHATDEFPLLAAEVELPPVQPPLARTGGRTARRARAEGSAQ